ncbi:MAG: HAMP domain-containing sensor histidine kinase [Bacteroidales bacterium]
MAQMKDEELLLELKNRFEENKKTIAELQQLTDELKSVNKKLGESEALKSHFISNITNEIINPFTSILGLSKTIMAVKKEDWKKVISMVALIHSEAFNLDFQLRNIFVAAKVEAGEIAPEILSVNLKALVQNLLESFRIESQKKNLEFEFIFECKPKQGEIFYFKTDPEKIKLILANLLSNAIKFSFDQGKIEVRVWNEQNIMHFLVKDQGTGISEENQQVIFDRFKRLDSGINSLNRGHGLGLSINKALIDLLNGKIDIQSTLGEGASFTVSIPEASADIAGYSAEGNDFLFDDNQVF